VHHVFMLLPWLLLICRCSRAFSYPRSQPRVYMNPVLTFQTKTRSLLAHFSSLYTHQKDAG
jgi:hypothetical protein